MKKIFILLACLFLMGCGKKEIDYTKVFESEDFINEQMNISKIRYSLIYLDDDDIYEVAVGENNLSLSDIAIFKYDSKKRFKLLGKFGNFGSIIYAPKQEMIGSWYGNGGCFYNFYSKVDENGIELLDAVYILQRADGSPATYYEVLDNVGINGDSSYSYLDADLNMKEISEEDYQKRSSGQNLYDGEWVLLDYDDMFSFSVGR